MKHFTLTLLLKENQNPKIIQDIKDRLIQEGFFNVRIEAVGRKRLAYTINEENFAEYFFFDFDEGTSSQNAVAAISEELNGNEKILRYLFSLRTEDTPF